MTAEEKREQILKRALPALFITIIYFIFISDIMGEQAAKAQEDYNNIMRRGIPPAALPGVYKQQEQVRSKLATLRTEQAQYLNDIKSMAGFLSGAGDTTDAAAQLANILAEHHLRVARELSESFASANLPPALNEVKTLLQESLKTEDEIKVQHLWLHGRFNDMYQALTAMHTLKLAAIPVRFSMSVPEEGEPGVLAWELVLWM